VNEDGQTLLLLEGGQNILQQLQVAVPKVLNGFREGFLWAIMLPEGI
jgi:hypothetical protein